MPRGPRSHLRPVPASPSTLQPFDVNFQLADRLAGVQEYERAVPVGDLDDVADRIDQTRVGGDVDHRDQADAVIHHLGQSVEVDSSVRGAGHDLDLGAGQTCPVQHVDGIIGVLGSCHQDPVSGLERNSAEERGPGSGGAVGQGDAAGFAAEQPAQGHLEVLPFRRTLLSSTVAADFGLSPEMPHHCPDRTLRRQ